MVCRSFLTEALYAYDRGHELKRNQHQSGRELHCDQSRPVKEYACRRTKLEDDIGLAVELT